MKIGKNVTDFSVGERVYPYPLYAKDDTRRAGTIGGFSEYILIPNAKRNHSLYSVDEKISDKLAGLIFYRKAHDCTEAKTERLQRLF